MRKLLAVSVMLLSMGGWMAQDAMAAGRRHAGKADSAKVVKADKTTKGKKAGKHGRKHGKKAHAGKRHGAAAKAHKTAKV